MIIIDREKCVRCGSCVPVCPRGLFAMEEQGPVVDNDRPCLECMHCTAAGPAKAIHFDSVPAGAEYPSTPEDELEKLTTMRRSVRHYKKQLPERAIITRALELAAWAPSGKNAHAYSFTVLWGIEETQRIFDLAMELCSEKDTAMVRQSMSRGVNLLTCGAPCVIVAWIPGEKPNPNPDAPIAMSTMELFLNKNGLATCWGGMLGEFANKVPELARALGVPEGCRVRCAMMTGYADGEVYRNVPYRRMPNVVWQGE